MSCSEGGKQCARAAIVAFLASAGPARNQEAARLLLEQMAGSREPRDRIEAARVLGIMQDPPVDVITALIIELLLAAEIAGHYRSYQVLAPLDPADARQAKVIAALRQTMEGELERIFRLIGLLAPAASLHDAYVGVRSSNSVVRANALEYLENVLKPGLREVLLPLIDSHVSERERAVLAARIVGPPVESSEQAVAVLLASDDPWLRSRAEIMANRAAEARTAEEEFAPRPTGIDADMGAG